VISRLPEPALLPSPAPPKRAQSKRLFTPQQNRDDVPPELLPGLQLLLQAYDYAKETDRDHDDFAVELTELRQRGMTNADCRWLVCKGWAHLLREVKRKPGEARCFDRDVGLVIHRHACLTLTSAGVLAARWLTIGTSHDHGVEKNGRVGPHWDRDRHELRVGSLLIKQFKLPSPNQEMILMALEEEGWAPRIDDPLPASRDMNAKQRLHDAIKNLNRNQKNRLMRFMGDGTGQGVRWELIVEQPASSAKST
jgi:hypothetical protein